MMFKPTIPLLKRGDFQVMDTVRSKDRMALESSRGSTQLVCLCPCPLACKVLISASGRWWLEKREGLSWLIPLHTGRVVQPRRRKKRMEKLLLLTQTQDTSPALLCIALGWQDIEPRRKKGQKRKLTPAEPGSTALERGLRRREKATESHTGQSRISLVRRQQLRKRGKLKLSVVGMPS